MAAALIDKDNSFLVIVDIQEKLAPAIPEIETVMAAALAMTRAAVAMDIPVVFTEHCVEKVGPTVAHIKSAAPMAQCLQKNHFGTLADSDHRSAFTKFAGKRPIVCGTETHVCVLQTVLGLVQEGFEPYVVADACGSRKALDKATGLSRMMAAGAEAVTAEMVIFEWLRRADTDLFRQVLPIIKAL